MRASGRLSSPTRPRGPCCCSRARRFSGAAEPDLRRDRPVAAQSELEVPVACVVADRCDEFCESDAFDPRRLRSRIQVAVDEALAARAGRAQQAVWDEMAARRGRIAPESETGAMHDLFEGE